MRAVRLEAVTQADVQGVSGRISINLGGIVFPAILHVGSNSVHVGALGERIVVADAHDITLEFDVSNIVLAISRVSIRVADAELGNAATEERPC